MYKRYLVASMYKLAVIIQKNDEMNIAIDTSILTRDRKLESSDILLLGKMSKLGLLKLHIPWIVFRETTTQNYIDAKNVVDKIIKDLNNLDRKGINQIEHFKFQKIAKQIEAINIETSTLKHWNDFIKQSKIILHKIDEKHGELVMNSYFLGQQPFPVPKSRKDIPDAFIYQALKTISNDSGQLYFICADNNLRNSCENLDDIIGIKEYSDFFNLDEFKIINEKYKLIEHYADELIIIEDNIEKIKANVNEDVFNDVDDIFIVSPNILDDNSEGRLLYVEKVFNVELDKTTIQYIDNYFYIPIKAEGHFIMEYFLYKSDYYSIDDRRNINITDDDWNDHYFLVEETFEVKFSFKYKIAKDKVDFLEFEDINFDEVDIIWKK